MTYYKNFAIVSSFFGLWVTSLFSSDNQILAGFSIILTFGIFHGANDIIILKNLLTNRETISFSKMLFYYLIMVFVGGILFYLIPWAILIVFIVVSGFHFGEQQLNYLDKNKDKIVIDFLILFYGLLILFLLFEFHQQEVQNIVAEITSYPIITAVFSYCLYITMGIFTILLTYMYLKYNNYRSKLLMEVFYLVVFAIIFRVSSLIWGFAIYFIIWHSIPSIMDQVIFLYGSISKVNFIKYFKSAVFYWVISLIGLATFYLLFKDLKLFNSIFFSFLAAITFPHVLVILKMFDKK